VFNESFLHRMKLFPVGEPFDRRNFFPLLHHRKGKTRIDTFSVDNHRAGAALPVVAPFLAAGQVKLIAQQIQQSCARVDVGIAPLCPGSAPISAAAARTPNLPLANKVVLAIAN
jgi:hypothetical protein